MEVSYKRDMNHTYLILQGGGKSGYLSISCAYDAVKPVGNFSALYDTGDG